MTCPTYECTSWSQGSTMFIRKNRPCWIHHTLTEGEGLPSVCGKWRTMCAQSLLDTSQPSACCLVPFFKSASAILQSTCCCCRTQRLLWKLKLMWHFKRGKEMWNVAISPQTIAAPLPAEYDPKGSHENRKRLRRLSGPSQVTNNHHHGRHSFWHLQYDTNADVDLNDHDDFNCPSQRRKEWCEEEANIE